MMLHHGCKANLTIFNKATKRKDARGLTMTFSENMGSFPVLSYLSQSVQEIVMVIKGKFSTEFHGEDAWVR